MNLRAPAGYLNLPDPVKKEYLQAPCGPRAALRGWAAWLVPDDLLGLDIRPACAIHDYLYAKGKTRQEKIEADEIFLLNLLSLVLAGTGRYKARLFLAVLYYLAVRFAGGKAFKNR